MELRCRSSQCPARMTIKGPSPFTSQQPHLAEAAHGAAVDGRLHALAGRAAAVAGAGEEGGEAALAAAKQAARDLRSGRRHELPMLGVQPASMQPTARQQGTLATLTRRPSTGSPHLLAGGLDARRVAAAAGGLHVLLHQVKQRDGVGQPVGQRGVVLLVQLHLGEAGEKEEGQGMMSQHSSAARLGAGQTYHTAYIQLQPPVLPSSPAGAASPPASPWWR